MAVKDLFKAVAGPRAIIARKADATNITVAEYEDVASGLHVFTNKMAKPFSPIGGGELATLKDDHLVMASEDFDQLTKIGTCANADCTVDLYATPDTAAALEGEEVNCPACGGVHKVSLTKAETVIETALNPAEASIDVAAVTAAALVEAAKEGNAVAGYDVADDVVAFLDDAKESDLVIAKVKGDTAGWLEGDTPESVAIFAAAKDGSIEVITEASVTAVIPPTHYSVTGNTLKILPKSAETSEAAASAEAEAEEVAFSGEELAASKKKLTTVLKKKAEKAKKAKSCGEDDVEEDIEDEDSYDDVEVVEDEEMEEEASVTDKELYSAVELEVAALHDIDVSTVTLANVTTGTVGVFAVNQDNRLVNVGMLHLNHAADDNRPMFDDLKKLRNAFVASLESKSPLDTLGFETATVVVNVPKVLEEQAAATVEAAKETASAVANETVADFEQSLGIAIAGMNKGVFDSPLAASLASQLERRGVQNASRLATHVIATASDEYMRFAITKAKELAGMTKDAREALAKMIGEANSILAANEDSALNISTASLQLPTEELRPVRQNRAPTPPAKQPRRLFSDVGY